MIGQGNGEARMLKAELPAPRLEFIFAAHVTVGEPRDLGDIGKGRRRIVPITGGEFSGPDDARHRASRRRRLADHSRRRGCRARGALHAAKRGRRADRGVQSGAYATARPR